MEEPIKHNMQRGNGVANDALAKIADLLVFSNKKIISLEKKIIGLIIALVGLFIVKK